MTHEPIEILKSKIEPYRPCTGDQVNAAKARMSEAQEYLSPPAVRGEIGILALGRGYRAGGDALFRQGCAGVATAQGHRVIVVPFVAESRSSVSKRIGKYLEDLQYAGTVGGIAEHPPFEQWVREQVEAAAGCPPRPADPRAPRRGPRPAPGPASSTASGVPPRPGIGGLAPPFAGMVDRCGHG